MCVLVCLFVISCLISVFLCPTERHPISFSHDSLFSLPIFPHPPDSTEHAWMNRVWDFAFTFRLARFRSHGLPKMQFASLPIAVYTPSQCLTSRCCLLLLSGHLTIYDTWVDQLWSALHVVHPARVRRQLLLAGVSPLLLSVPGASCA